MLINNHPVTSMDITHIRNEFRGHLWEIPDDGHPSTIERKERAKFGGSSRALIGGVMYAYLGFYPSDSS